MADQRPLAGKVCLVTGATRGIGKGIAIQLGQAGATVYITGRTLSGPTSLELTAQEVEDRGGICKPVHCDHSKTEEVEKLFKQIEREQDGQLDVLVNNAFAAVRPLLECMEKKMKFYEAEPELWDDVNNVGLRNVYFCSVYAGRLMAARQKGLIVNISSAASIKYSFNVAVGVGKEAVDRMSADCAEELKDKNVAVVSLWPGLIRQENIEEMLAGDMEGEIMDMIRQADKMKTMDSPEYPGKCVVHMAKDPNIMKKTGRVLISAELGDEYGFVDKPGNKTINIRRVSDILYSLGYTKTAAFVPRFIKIPCFIFTLAGSKF